jgi:PhzF family phenazine biosynthesis protein
VLRKGKQLKTRPFVEVDVFANGPLTGNPLAVVLDGTDLTPKQMQAFANWTNFSETTFVLPPTKPEADYAVRIFTPTVELPFAGHPTLGTCHAFLRSGGGTKTRGRVVQECATGLIAIQQTEDRLAFAAPPRRRSDPLEESELKFLATGLGLQRSDVIAGQWCDNGPGWRALLLNSHAALLKAKPDTKLLIDSTQTNPALVLPEIGLVAALPKLGLVAATPSITGVDFELRAFFPANDVYFEDPVTGSLNAAVAQWLIGTQIAPAQYVAAQGSQLGRNGRVFIEREGLNVWVGGYCTTIVTGEVDL